MPEVRTDILVCHFPEQIRRAGMPVLAADTTTPHKVNCMALWGEKTGKLRVQIIVGSGAYAHRNTVESRSSGLYACLFPKYQEMTSTAFLILFSSSG